MTRYMSRGQFTDQRVLDAIMARILSFVGPSKARATDNPSPKEVTEPGSVEQD